MLKFQVMGRHTRAYVSGQTVRCHGVTQSRFPHSLHALDGTHQIVPAETFEDAEWSLRLLMEGEKRILNATQDLLWEEEFDVSKSIAAMKNIYQEVLSNDRKYEE